MATESAEPALTPKFEVGCFEIEETRPGRWRLRNTRTTFEHVTFGTEAEVREQALLQSEAWERKFAALNKAKGQRGSAWRERSYLAKARETPPKDM